MAYKLSNYNFEVEHDEHILLYNGLSDKLLPVSYEEYSALETLLEHLDVFEQMYPDLFNDFKKAGFIIDGDFDELHLSGYKTKMQSINNLITTLRSIPLWTVI